MVKARLEWIQKGHNSIIHHKSVGRLLLVAAKMIVTFPAPQYHWPLLGYGVM